VEGVEIECRESGYRVWRESNKVWRERRWQAERNSSLLILDISTINPYPYKALNILIMRGIKY
jgi:hypothetical protein